MPIDPALARRLADALAAIAQGDSPKKALRTAGVRPGDAERALHDLAVSLRSEEGAKRREKAGALGEAVAYSDGGSRGNPGDAACAAIIYDGSGAELLRRAKRIGIATNNQAEYEGAILALELAGQLGAKKLEVRMDSELIVRQLEGTYKVKNEGLKPYYARACALVESFQSVAVTHIPRRNNTLADKLVNACLDGKELPED
jgi:ribonuclease HI